MKRLQFITLLFTVFLLAGQGCKQTTLENQNANASASGNVNAGLLPQTNSMNTTVSTNTPTSGSSNTNTATVADAAARAKSDVEKIARFFTEYFGSYSTDSNFSNITGLKIYMTSAMQQWAEGYVQSAKAGNNNAAGYLGVTTKAVSSNVSTFFDAEGKAEVVVSTQRRESTGTTGNARIYYQDMTVSFLKEKSVWKVNEAKWK